MVYRLPPWKHNTIDKIANVTQVRISHSCDEMLSFRAVIQRGKGACRGNGMVTMVHDANRANISSPGMSNRVIEQFVHLFWALSSDRPAKFAFAICFIARNEWQSMLILIREIGT